MNHDSIYELGGTKVNVTDAGSHCKLLGIPEYRKSVGSERNTEMQQMGKCQAFILLSATSGKLAEIKFCGNLPEAIRDH